MVAIAALLYLPRTSTGSRYVCRIMDIASGGEKHTTLQRGSQKNPSWTDLRMDKQISLRSSEPGTMARMA